MRDKYIKQRPVRGGTVSNTATETIKQLELIQKVCLFMKDLTILPIFAKLPQTDALSLLAEADEVHFGFQGHQERAAVGELQVEPQT